MDHLADSTAELYQGGQNRYSKGVPRNDSPGEECKPVIFFESLDSACMPKSGCVLIVWYSDDGITTMS